MHKQSDIEKKRLTNIKSAQGSFALAQIMTVIYVVKTLISKKFNFWFCNYITELAFKSASFTSSYEGSFSNVFEADFKGTLPTVAAIAIMLVYTAVLLAIAFSAQKKPKLLYAELGLYALDTLCLVVGRIFAFPSDFSGDGLIDVIFHGFVLLFLIVGTVSQKRLNKES